ncbi:DUF4252 domain-containing protein [Chitinophaga vietnamensis]|uniref:DUF4252 domain-containing protein n=1 Tax=Chitinophaga vietnamensis TaxID=2593957 RepID=UPI00117874BF|nr:DUF4252 domain-containing protein [Chitinophaga vietnamensis]
MKSFVIGCCCLLAASAAFGQEKSIREFRDNFRGKADEASVRVGAAGMRLAGWVLSFDDSGDPDVSTMRKLMRKVRNVKVYTFSNADSSLLNGEEVNRLKHNLESRDHFETLMEVREKSGSRVQVFSKGKDDELGNVVMLLQDAKDFVVVNLHTSLKVEDINDLIRQFAKN